MNPFFRTATVALWALGSSAFAAQLLESGSFEWPPVTHRKARSEGADVSKSAMNAEWIAFTDKPDSEGGRLVVGVTNEIARTGRQSIFVQFDKLTKPQTSAVLASDFIPILPEKPYHFGIWGRMDRKLPISLDQRVPYLKLRVDWFKADKEEQTGDVVWRVQPIPGSPNLKPLFTAGKWSEFYTDVKSPEDAAYVRITWYWDTTPKEGMTDGIIYFDDAIIVGESGPKEDPFAEELAEAEREAKAAEAAAEAAAKSPGGKVPTPPAPAATPAPSVPKSAQNPTKAAPLNITPIADPAIER
jgi:hypothetical protein